jgi:hypothetical protein
MKKNGYFIGDLTNTDWTHSNDLLFLFSCPYVDTKARGNAFSMDQPVSP